MAAAAAWLIPAQASAGEHGQADPNRGRFIAIGGSTQHQRIACAQCHGIEGSGDFSGAFPRLAGQSEWYIYKSLRDYADGLRPNRVMAPVARTLEDRDMQDVAAFYASVGNAPFPPREELDAQTLQVGGAISAAGIAGQGVPPCAGCHGVDGEGRAPIYPRLAGQYAAYLEHQLHEWKNGRRQGDPANIMELIAKALTDEQIRAVSLYFSSIRPDRQVKAELPAVETAPPAPAEAGASPPYLDPAASSEGQSRGDAAGASR
jgi:cytochrome c553